MTIPTLHDKVLLRPTDLEPSQSGYTILGTFNPGVARYGDDIILLVRVAEAPLVDESGPFVSPRAEWVSGSPRWVEDTFDRSSVDASDPRLLRLPNGRVRLRYISHLRLVRLNLTDLKVKEISTPNELRPSVPWEEFGIEDPRITQIGDTYYITYVAISRKMGVATALMMTKDFNSFERKGIIFPTENKDVVLLPEKWNGHYVAFNRPVSNYMIDLPSVVTSLSSDAIYWGKHRFLFGPREGNWESVRIGAGPPPLRVQSGWLLIYHGVSPATHESPVGRYCAGAVMLNGANPTDLLARCELPLLCPERRYEREGFAANVIFPTGAILIERGAKLLLFCGGADEVVSVLTLSVDSILKHLGY
ncbi:MAG: glycoside hydrolase family 130 protein [Candidatus Hermodarchaeia archaeon]|jgi:predicted GH43/DUF377 family glycosyl hydrolase